MPVVRTPEPAAVPVHFPLDLTPFLPPAALATGRIRVERASALSLLAACAATADGRVVARPVEPLRPGDAETEIPVANPADRAALVAALRSGSTQEVEDRFLVYLAGRHAFRDRLFAPAHEGTITPGPFAETLPPAAGRWLYRVRSADRAGHVSAGSASVRAIVRVPSMAAGAAPVRLASEPGDPAALLRVRVPRDPALTHLLLFHAPAVGVGPVEVSGVMRVPNRPDLLPEQGLWLRAPGGAMLRPAATALNGPGVLVEPDGDRALTLTVPGGPGARTRVWLATLSRDGVPSALAGPYTILLPPPDLPQPVLSIAGASFSWTWPTGAELPASLLLSLERSAAGQPWERISPLLDAATTAIVLDQPPGTWRFRVRVAGPDGRAAQSTPVDHIVTG